MKRALIAVGAIAFTFAVAPVGLTGRALAGDFQNGASAGTPPSSSIAQNDPGMGSASHGQNGQIVVATTYPGSGRNPRGEIFVPANSPTMGPMMAVMGPEIMHAEMSDPKIRGAIMEIHGRMLEDVGKLLEKRGREMQGESSQQANANGGLNDNGNSHMNDNSQSEHGPNQ